MFNGSAIISRFEYFNGTGGDRKRSGKNLMRELRGDEQQVSLVHFTICRKYCDDLI